MADEKLYTPTVIQENPLPGAIAGESFDVSTPSNKTTDTYGSASIKEQPIPKKAVASELEGEAMNTRTRKIIRELTFEPSGAIAVGQFIEGESGDVRITPYGIVARNLLGESTFLLDGTTGDALFKGTLEAGTIIGGGGAVLIEAEDGNGRIVINDQILIGYQKNGF